MDAPKPTRFLDLPGEVRNLIYTEILAPTGYVTLKISETSKDSFKAYATRSKIDTLQSRSSSSDDRQAQSGISLSVLQTQSEMLFGPGDRNLFVHNPEEKFVLLARFVSIEIGFEMLHFQGYKCLWDILGASTKLKKLTLRNGQEIGGAFFCETEGRLYYAGQSFDRLNDVRKPLEYLNSVLDKKVQKTLNFPGMRLCPPTGMFGNEIRLPREGSALPHIAKSLHAVFRGELWVNGNMWMKDGEEMDGLEGLIEQVKAESKELKRKQLEVMAAWEEEEEKRLRSSVPPIPGGVSGKRIVFGMPSYTA